MIKLEEDKIRLRNEMEMITITDFEKVEKNFDNMVKAEIKKRSWLYKFLRKINIFRTMRIKRHAREMKQLTRNLEGVFNRGTDARIEWTSDTTRPMKTSDGVALRNSSAGGQVSSERKNIRDKNGKYRYPATKEENGDPLIITQNSTQSNT